MCMTFPRHPEKGYSYLYFTEYETKAERSSILYKITQLIVVETGFEPREHTGPPQGMASCGSLRLFPQSRLKLRTET